MAFPASNGVLSDILERTCRGMLLLKQLAQSESAAMAAGSVSSSRILATHEQLRGYRTVFSSAAGTSGIGPYAEAQLGDAQLDVASEFNAVLAAIDAVTTWLQANFPTDGTYLLARTWSGGDVADRQFTPAQTVGLRAALDALAATIA